MMRVTVLPLLALSLLLPVGCRTARDIDGTYGRQRGVEGGASVNGTRVLGDMFRVAGYEVHTRKRLTPSMEGFDVAVWIPDSYEPPTKKQRDFLEGWLGNKPGRTLVFVGRDYDARVAYWEIVQGQASAEQALEVRRRLALSKAERDRQRAVMKKLEFARWYTLVRDAPPQRITSIHSPPGKGWEKGIDAGKLEIRTFSRMRPPRPGEVTNQNNESIADEYEVLLSSSLSALVMRVRDQYLFPSSQVLAVANGSFLLNLPLVNSEHRKLAARLIGECGKHNKVVFIESDVKELRVFDKEPDDRYPTGLEPFTVWPLGAVIMHVMFFGVLWCFTRYPIFGRPRERYEVTQSGSSAGEPPEESVSSSDFGQHISALGRMLERTGGLNYAVAQIEHYQRTVKRDSSSAGSPRVSPPESEQDNPTQK